MLSPISTAIPNVFDESKAILLFHRPDILVLAGDISKRRQPDSMLQALNRLDLPVLLIRGNSDSRGLVSLLQPFARLRSVHLSKARFNGVEIVGVGGTLPLPFHSRLGFKETDVVARVSGDAAVFQRFGRPSTALRHQGSGAG
jgi:Icc-related predicted phosphoesterase